MTGKQVETIKNNETEKRSFSFMGDLGQTGLNY